MLYEIKNLSTGAVKDVDPKGRRISGYLSAFGNQDKDGDVIESGAFAKTLSERSADIFFLNQHNWSQPHGKFAELKEDAHGLYFVSNPLIDTTFSQDAMKLYEAGILKEHSIGFSTVKWAYDQEKNIRHLKELKLYEGSNVTLGANSSTPFLGFKSGLKEIQDQASRIMKALRDGSFTDETFLLLEIALKQLQADAFELGKKSLQEPTETVTPPDQEPIIETLKSFNNTLLTP